MATSNNPLDVSSLLEQLNRAQAGDRSRGRTKFVRLHPTDKCEGLHPIFLEDPHTWQPQPDEKGRVDTWGVMPLDPWFLEHEESVYMRAMRTQMLYSGDPPEKQFINVLMERKRAKLREGLARAQELAKCDYIVNIELETQVKVWRRVKLSAAIKLSVLQDKVISPVMGWTRHYHGYLFTDFTDGSQFGPERSEAIDMMHIHNNGWIFMDDTEHFLAQVLQTPGQEMGYMYDLGDRWNHAIRLIEVVPAESSDGSVKVLDGANACPPEDSDGLDGMGNRAWDEFMAPVAAAEPGEQQKKAKNKIRAKAAHFTAANIVPGERYELFVFSVAAAQREVDECLRTMASAPGGQKAFRSGPSLDSGATGSSFGFSFGTPVMTEQQREKRERKSMAVCAQCGSPNHLSTCGGCKTVRFCGRACQLAAWKEWHKAECKEAQRQREQAQPAGGGERAS